MADPVSISAVTSVLGGVGMGASALGALTGAEGSLYGGSASKAMYDYQAGIARVNASLAKADAEYERVAGERTAEIAGLKGREIVASTKAGFGAGNIDPTSGSAKGVLTSEAAVNAANLNMIRANTAKKAYGYEVTAAEDTAQAGIYDLAGRTSRTAGDIGAVSSLLGGVGSVSSKWLQGQQAGMWGK